MSCVSTCIPENTFAWIPWHRVCLSRVFVDRCSVHSGKRIAPSIEFLGSPKAYSCFVDESLNSILRALAMYAHRSRFAFRVFSMWDLQGALRLSVYVPPPHQYDLCVNTGA